MNPSEAGPPVEPFGGAVVDGDKSVVAATGELSVDGSAPLQAQIQCALANRDVGDLVLDLSAVTFLDSYALRLLISTRRALAVRGGTLTLRQPNAAVTRLIALTGLDRLFTIDFVDTSASAPEHVGLARRASHRRP